MKKLLIVLSLALCLLGLSACGGEESTAAEATGAEELEPLKERALPELSREDSLRMLRYMSGNRALISGERLYSLDYDGDYLPVLAEYSLSDGLRRNAVLAENCVPAFLTELDGRLYYVNQRENNVLESIAIDGSYRKILKEGPCDWLLIEDGALYYCDGEQRWCRSEPDGSGETRLMERPCVSPWSLGDSLLYQSPDDERLHLYWFADGTDVTLTEHGAWAPVIWDGRLYYSSEERLCSVGLNGLGAVQYAVPPLSYPAELIPEENGLKLRGISDDRGLKQWTVWPEDAEGTLQYLTDRGYRLCDYAGGEGRVDTIYNLDGRVRCFLYTDAEGQEYVYIAGRVSG